MTKAAKKQAGPADDALSRARAKRDAEDAASLALYESAHPDARELVDAHADYLARRDPALAGTAKRRAIAEACVSWDGFAPPLLKPAPFNPPCPATPKGDE